MDFPGEGLEIFMCTIETLLDAKNSKILLNIPDFYKCFWFQFHVNGVDISVRNENESPYLIFLVAPHSHSFFTNSNNFILMDFGIIIEYSSENGTHKSKLRETMKIT